MPDYQPNTNGLEMSQSTQKSRPIPQKHKAGVFIFGEMDYEGTPQMCVLAPWSEGNFSDDGQKAYLLPKGTVDHGEESPQAAIREVKEETGIDIERICDPTKLYDLPSGERIRGSALTAAQREELELYPHIELVEWLEDGKPVFDGITPSNRGNPAHLTMYGVRVKGIEHLKEHIKFKDNGMKGMLVSKPAIEVAADLIRNKKLPDFETLLDTLRTGMWRFGSKKHHGRLFDPNFAETEKYYLFCKRLGEQQRAVDALMQQECYSCEEMLEIVRAAQKDFEAIQNGERHITTPLELDELFRSTPINNTIKDDLRSIRKFMEGTDKYAIYKNAPLLSDTTGLKMDTKQHPLRYYQESADIIPAKDYVQRMVDFAQAHPEGQYHRSQFRRAIDDRAPGRQFKGREASAAEVVLKALKKASQANDVNLLEQQIRNLGEQADALSRGRKSVRAA